MHWRKQRRALMPGADEGIWLQIASPCLCRIPGSNPAHRCHLPVSVTPRLSDSSITF
ncbi:hypothetical protein [Candidatus Formimonas warabiya]|uniref:hypothetical protein n=1 Tax=Formimonas warabiya TaxID=1761012 RepID=UPI001BE49159|nr:hypothetical protein [Candidatus Formimonas warabiya]